MCLCLSNKRSFNNAYLKQHRLPEAEKEGAIAFVL